MTDKRIDKATARALGEATKDALEAVAASFDMTVKVNGGRYDPTTGTFTPRVTFSQADTARIAFEQLAVLFGFEKDDYGKEVRLGTGTFRIVGLNTRRQKYPVDLENIKTGSLHKGNDEQVLRALGRKVNRAVVQSIPFD